MENEVRLNIKITDAYLQQIKQIAKKKGCTVSSIVRTLLADFVEANKLLLDNPTTEALGISKKILDNLAYHSNAQRKRELKQAIQAAHEDYRDTYSCCGKKAKATELARASWKQAILNYNTFCTDCQQNKTDY